MNETLLALDTGIQLNIYVQPNSSCDKFAGRYLDRLKIKISAKALDGAANKAACKLLANYFAVAKNCVTIVRGLRSPEKTVHIAGNSNYLAEAASALLTELDQ